MGLFLKQVLKTLCALHHWSYAVFWKIGCHNPKLLIWEECHYEAKPANPELSFGDWEGFWASDAHSSHLKLQTGDQLHLLVTKMMLDNQVNLVGQGLVGRAAFTGNHNWILAHNYNGDAHPPEVFSEIHHQISAGMQTIAVIPVVPHGVVQLGSSLTIMENMGFVNSVKSLIVQLGCVPGVLLSDNIVEKESAERIGLPVSFDTPDSIPFHMGGDKVLNSSRLSADSYNQQSISFLSSKIAHPPDSQIRQIQDTLQSTASTFHASNLTNPVPNSNNCQSEIKLTAAMKSHDPLRGWLANEVVGPKVTPSNPDTWMSQHMSLNSRPNFSHRSGIAQSDAGSSIVTLLEHRVLSEISPQNLVINSRNECDRFSPPQMKTNGGLIVNSHVGSSISGRELHNGVSSNTGSTSSTCANLNPCSSEDISHNSIQLARAGLQKLDSSRVEEVPLSSLAAQVCSRVMLLGGSQLNLNEVKHSKNEPSAKKEKISSNLFQAASILSSHQNEYHSLDEDISNSVADFPKHESGTQSENIADVGYADSYAQAPSTEDLYDVLGVDFKNRLLSSNLDSLLTDGYANSHMSVDSSTLMNMQEASSNFFSASEGILDSGIFPATGTDHLLDAVVSRAHSTAKQSSDDAVSCKTSLTKISSSLTPSNSPMYGLVDKSNHVQKEFNVLPKSLEKSATIASSSFRSGCSKDDVASCSQATSIYGSQLSSWVDHSMRCDNSASTAYSKKNDEINKPNRKRLKPGENPRPRPKDRQMIQDRVKELREIVPNGAKCSIDSLLERTIKHMLFLQSVTKHADKLKQTGECKIMNKEGGLLLKDNFDGGATWAFEVESQSMVCPIIVEDLNLPRQMLVEMLCEERGFFLEIADLIRGLGLTILKGVIEARNDKIWARFAVEANKDVTRMEVFMSLVRLLEQTEKGGTSEINNMIARHTFPQATSIAATGSLQ
ncbi:transcription factor LHW [Mercurialis annua]|uniref:transcription factor LHW n=1 Tax=Mercurialis annua TaxID=3986 RepID=UPI00215E109A|nr:transcription factor LHW [Mercurialis annua]